MGSILDEVIGPNVVWAFWPQPDARPIIQPDSSFFGLFLRDFQPLLPPDPFDPLMVHMTAAVVQHPGDHAISIAPELSRQLNDVISQLLFVRQATGNLALRGTMLPEGAASPALRHAKGLPHMIYALTTAGRAQKFPRAASVRIILSSVKSDTARLSRAFSVSNSFSRFN